MSSAENDPSPTIIMCILKEHKPIEDGHIYKIEGSYHFYARIRDKNMIHVPDELIKEMQIEKDDLVNITIQKG